jgi:DNA-binding IclR family transcriptional regulator
MHTAPFDGPRSPIVVTVGELSSALRASKQEVFSWLREFERHGYVWVTQTPPDPRLEIHISAIDPNPQHN